MSSLGSFSYHLQEQLHKLLSNGCDTLVQKELGRSIGLLACVLTEQTEIRRYPSLPFDEPVGSHVKLYCPTCDAKSGTSGNGDIACCCCSSSSSSGSGSGSGSGSSSGSGSGSGSSSGSGSGSNNSNNNNIHEKITRF